MKKTVLKQVYYMTKLFTVAFMIQCLTMSFLLAWNGNAQVKSIEEVKVHLSLDDVKVEKAFKELEKHTDYNFVFATREVKDLPLITFESQGQSLYDILLDIAAQANLNFKQVDLNIHVKRSDKDRTVSVVENVDVTVTGTVTDENGEPIPGVTVSVPGTTTGTATDLEGKYALSVPEGSTLVFSFIGFETQSIVVGDRSIIDVTLREDLASLDEVVVVGYGSKRKKDVISGISSLSTEELGLEDQISSTAGDLLKGRIAGVNIRESTGAAGAAPNIQIRGISSINAGVSPLIVIDGFPVGTSFPQTLNPDEIAEISVLKDAAATAIYGARGSNGVVIIETKNAREGVKEFTYNAYIGSNEVPKSWRPQMMNALEYAQFNVERIESLDEFNNASSLTPIPEIFLEVLNNPDAWKDGGTDWLDEFLREGKEALIQNHSLTYRVGNDRTKTVISAGYFKQNGIIPSDDFQRLSLRTKFDATLSERIKMGVNLSAARTNNNRVDTDGARSALWAAVVGSPLQSPYDENGNPKVHMPGDAPGYFAMPNPLHSLNAIDNSLVNRDLQVNVDFDVEIMKGLHYTPRIYGRQLTRSLNYYKPTTVGNVSIAGSGNLLAGSPPQPNSKMYENFELDNWGIDNLLNYSSSFQDHNLNILIGHTIQKESAFTNQINGAVFPSDEVVNFGEAGEILGSNNYYDWSLIAGFGRINYDYKGKYLVEFNFRREGSSRLGANNRFGDFPSGAFGWRVSQENFYPTDFLINEFLISASFGKTGNNSIGNYDALGRLGAIRTVIGNSISEGKFQSSISNNDLKWETAFQYQFGVNLGILDDRITLKTNYFKKITKDMLFNVALPGASGYGSTRINLGEMENNGLEIEIYSVNMPDGNFQWNTNFNVSFLDNKVTHMPEQIDRIISGPLRGTNITTVGEEVGAFYGFVRLGLFDEETIDDPNLYGWQGDQKILGTNIFKDINGDGHIDYEDQIVIGSPHPDIIFGFNNQFTFKNISLSFLATGMLGYDIMRASNGVFYNNAARWNVSKELLNRWKSPEHPGNGQVPRTEYNLGNREGMDDWLEPGDHLWIKNVNLSYSLPDRLLQSIGKINGLRIYFTVKNLARFDKYSGFNPEVSQSGGNPLSIGVDNFVYPISRSYSLGVDLNF